MFFNGENKKQLTFDKNVLRTIWEKKKQNAPYVHKPFTHSHISLCTFKSDKRGPSTFQMLVCSKFT